MKTPLRSSALIATLLMATATAWADIAPPSGPIGASAPTPTALVPESLFHLPAELEVTLWASTPLFSNPTNIDIDAAGRIWVAEGVRYRSHHERAPEGDRIVVVSDTDGDGTADESHVFVQEPLLIAPLGVAVIGNKIVVSQPPHLLVYTDVDGDTVFDPAKDTREVLLTGFNGQNHDHSLHSVTVGPDGKWYFNSGNCGGRFTDKSGKTFTIFGSYRPSPIGPFTFPHDANALAGKPSDDGHTYVGGFTVRMNPDGTDAEIIGHNYRNSYEQSVTSFGDVFQNDNDDPPACRVSWVMEYANFGFSSNDGQRTWKADQRPGQTIPVAEWRQDDPGITPAGDVYGGGSPTGNVYYEGGALGDKWIGTFFACEPGRNTVFSYQPKLAGAGFALERNDFLTSNASGEFAGSDFLGGKDSVNGEIKTLFRPSDIAVGPDGALYVSDWFDPRVGGHQDLDDSCSGAIYRIAPKGFVSKVPTLDLASVAGQVDALRSPAVHVRALAFNALVAGGRASLEPVAALLDDPNPYIQARAINVLYRLGVSGIRTAGDPTAQPTTQRKIAAYRALRHAPRTAGLDPFGSAVALAHDADPAVRREVALSLRNESLDTARDLLVAIAMGYDGKDRSYLEAFGTGATGKEADVYTAVKAAIGDDDAHRWSDAFADIAWRLHPVAALPDFLSRAGSGALSPAQREQALDSIAFIPDRAAADAMLTIGQLESPVKSGAIWWLLNRNNNDWKEYDLMTQLKERGIYDPAKVVIQEVIAPAPDEAQKKALSLESVLALTGDAERGKVTSARCIMCHQVGGLGVAYGPPLDGWGKSQTSEVVARSIIDPSSDISHGFDATELKTKDGQTIHGLVIQEGNPTIVLSTGGLTQIIPKNIIAETHKLGRSVMLSAAQLALTEQDVADLVAYLRSN